MNNFQPIIISWRLPMYPFPWRKVLCTRQIEVDYFREKLKNVKFYEQRVYSVTDKEEIINQL